MDLAPTIAGARRVAVRGAGVDGDWARCSSARRAHARGMVRGDALRGVRVPGSGGRGRRARRGARRGGRGGHRARAVRRAGKPGRLADPRAQLVLAAALRDWRWPDEGYPVRRDLALFADAAARPRARATRSGRRCTTRARAKSRRRRPAAAPDGAHARADGRAAVDARKKTFLVVSEVGGVFMSDMTLENGGGRLAAFVHVRRAQSASLLRRLRVQRRRVRAASPRARRSVRRCLGLRFPAWPTRTASCGRTAVRCSW